MGKALLQIGAHLLVVANQVARQNQLIQKIKLSGLALQRFVALDEAGQLFL